MQQVLRKALSIQVTHSCSLSIHAADRQERAAATGGGGGGGGGDAAYLSALSMFYSRGFINPSHSSLLLPRKLNRRCSGWSVAR